MELQNIPLAIASSSGRSKKSNAAELVNLYIHLDEAGGKSKALILSTPGAEIITVFDYHILGFYQFNDVVYAVTKNKLYKVISTDTGFDAQVIGDVSMVGEVSFADNGTEMVFVGENGYAYNPTTDTLKNMDTEIGWYSSNTVAYLDGYFIFSRNGTGQFFVSQLFSTSLDPIDWATGEAAPDDTLAVMVSNRQLWVIGERTSEVWYDSGDPLFPFTRIPGAVVDTGTIGHETVAKAQNTIMFVGDDLRVYTTKGYSLLPISTQAIEYHISQTDVKKLKAFTFHERGRWFYSLTMDDSKTFVYDTLTTLWHTRSSDDVGRWKMDGVFNNYKDGINYGFARHNLYKISEDINTEDGKNVLREIISLPITKSVNRIRIHELELDMEVGLLNTAEVALQMSSDGGRSWSNKNIANTGAPGQAMARVKWRRLGQHRNAAAKFTITADTPITILSLNIRAD